jgi:hypothetical protein
MTTYTKNTLVTYVQSVDAVGSQYVTSVFNKATQLVAEGKTDGSYLFDTPHIVRRPWIDQAAAEEWINFIIDLANADVVDITGTQIVDAPQ